MAKDLKPLIIQAPRTGIAQSPHVGFGDIRNLDIFTTPGVAKLNNALDKESASVVDAQTKWIVRDPGTGNLYSLDSNGVIYKSTNAGDTWTEISDRGGVGQGLAVWKGYVFIFEDTKIDVMDITDDSFDDDWQIIDSDSLWHPTWVSKNDGKLYFGAGRYVGSVEEVFGQNFDPATGGTFTYTQQALDLPEDYRIKSLVELGNDLMIGTWKGSAITDFKIADIFPWDRSSPSFRKPVQINENGINAMLVMGGQIIILAGVGGTIYKSDGYNAVPIGQIPNSIADIDGGKFLEPYPGAIMSFKGRIFFGISSASTSGMGIYSLRQTSAGNILNLENIISSEGTGGTNPLVIGALLGITRDQYVVGWRDNTVYGIDRIDVDAYDYTTTYQGYFESPLYQIGTLLNPRQFSQIEFQLAKKLAANEGIKIDFRVNLTDSFTNIGIYDFATLGAIISHNIKCSIPASEFLQIRVSETGTTTTPHFRNLILS